jgi:O6-methylguanine-DNA--protein-cysteine methyltransferase
VVKSDGSIGGYNGLRTSTTGTLAKIKLLKKEGVKFSKSSKVVFN